MVHTQCPWASHRGLDSIKTIGLNRWLSFESSVCTVGTLHNALEQPIFIYGRIALDPERLDYLWICSVSYSFDLSRCPKSWFSYYSFLKVFGCKSKSANRVQAVFSLCEMPVIFLSGSSFKIPFPVRYSMVKSNSSYFSDTAHYILNWVMIFGTANYSILGLTPGPRIIVDNIGPSSTIVLCQASRNLECL